MTYNGLNQVEINAILFTSGTNDKFFGFSNNSWEDWIYNASKNKTENATSSSESYAHSLWNNCINVTFYNRYYIFLKSISNGYIFSEYRFINKQLILTNPYESCWNIL